MSRRGLLVLVIAVLAAAVLAVALVWWAPARERAFLPFASGRSCVVAVTDDTDFFQFDTTAPVYALIDSLGIRVTKTVWAFDHADHPPSRAGLSLEDPAYREWVLGEAARGHEIALHSATAGHDERAVTVEAHRYLEALTGERPRMMVFHSTNREAFYWGSHRLPNPFLRRIYDARTGGRSFEGEDPKSPHYWVDVSRWLVRYVRGYTTNAVNTLAVNPSMPYSDPWAPASPLWCASSNGRLAEEFVELLSPANVQSLKDGEGVSIIYTHLASGFTEPLEGGGARVTPRARETFARCGGDPDIEFAPAGEVLDRLRLIQFLEDAVDGAELAVEPVMLTIPAGLVPAIDDVSVVPSRLPKPLDAPRGVSDESVDLKTWLDAVGWEVAPGDVSVFDYAREISLRERWRLVLRWLAMSFASPAYAYESGRAGA
ncbi:MAG: hypothetical protein ABIG03_05120 [Candidatus Eisenbacteria bacterium]